MTLPLVSRDELLLLLVLGRHFYKVNYKVCLVVAHLMALSLEGQFVQTRVTWFDNYLLTLGMILNCVTVQC
jgi:hypothetical protein